eukprot:195783_1
MLYHGVNQKMILNPSATQSFDGPLSTTSSYQVAATFAKSRGMILSITSQFPRLQMCKAFDASIISGYPAEQEWLIAHLLESPKCVDSVFAQKDNGDSDKVCIFCDSFVSTADVFNESHVGTIHHSIHQHPFV